MKKSLMLLCVGVLFFKLYCMSPESEFNFPIDVTIETSKNEITVGDSLEIIVTAKLNMDHENYHKDDSFVFIKRDNISLYTLINWGVKSEKIDSELIIAKERNREAQILEIIYSDNDKILDSQNKTVQFKCIVKLNRKPFTREIPFELYFFQFNKIENYGSYSYYVMENGKPKSDTYITQLYCSEPGLRIVGDEFYPLEVSDELSEDVDK
ncbi:MAG: hypothetical protein KAS49_05080 [Candidatus Cloacimonetes bacterium]|nr:hypothetical protein [Candidatus Cloacimonadota bacterium]